MILELTKENLLNSGCNEQEANELLITTITHNFQSNSGNFYVSKIENKFYTGIDYYRKTYFELGSIHFPYNCPDLTNEYFDLSLAIFLKEQKRDLGTLFNKSDQYKKFISLEIEKTRLRIENQQAFIKKVDKWRFPHKQKEIAVCEAFISYLESKPSELEKPKSAEAVIIDEYKSSISGYISTIIDFKLQDGKQNPFYYYDRIVNFHNHIDKMLKENDNVKDRYELLISFNFHIKSCLQDIVELFIAYYNFNENEPALINDITLKMFDVDASFNGIKNIEQNIAYNVSKGDYDIAIKIQDYCVPLFKEIKILLRDSFFVELDRSPLKAKYDEVLNDLENSINIERINLLKELKPNNKKEPQQPENNDIRFSEFPDFLIYYKNEALTVDLSKENINVYRILQTQQNKFKVADLDSEIDEVCEFSKRAMFLCKEALNVAFINEHYKAKFINHTPKFLIDLKLYFEYKDLYEKTVSKENQQPQQTESNKANEVKAKKIAEKWFALLYWIELSANGHQPPKSNEGTFIKSEIEKIGSQKTGTTGQSFYRKFIEIDLNNENLINRSFGKDWKVKIIELSNNNQLVVSYIENKYTSNK